MMNDNMKMVLKALRSGEYKQGFQTLQDDDRYCCLGVMCDVYARATGMELVRDEDRGYLYGGDLSGQEGVMAWVGLKSCDGHSTDHDTLIEMNDENGKTFSEIADFIESEPQGLLV
jgi:hypothetical protein